MRCQQVGGHHNTFILNRPGKPGINHVAFTVSDIHEVIGGGIAMSKKGWKTEIGPGRHPISSAYFWYFENPLAAPLEYYADEDYCTEDWKPSTFERKPELFAEWAIIGGIDGKTRRQACWRRQERPRSCVTRGAEHRPCSLNLRRIVMVEAHRRRSGRCPLRVHSLGTGETFEIKPAADGFYDVASGTTVRVDGGSHRPVGRTGAGRLDAGRRRRLRRFRP